MNLTDIIRSITGGKASKRTAAELRADLATIDLVALEAKVTEIEGRRRDLLVQGTDAELATNSQELAEANLLAERGQALVDTLTTRLIPDAEAREKIEDCRAQATKARTVQGELIESYVALHVATLRVVELLTTINQQRDTIRRANILLGENRLQDLKVPFPETLLAEKFDIGPGSLPRVDLWNLSAYWPVPPSPHGQFDLMAKLLPANTRKAA